MKPLNQHPTTQCNPSKVDYHIHENGKKVENWWEEVGNKGDGKLHQELQHFIDEGIEEFEIQQQEDNESYNQLIKDGINDKD